MCFDSSVDCYKTSESAIIYHMANLFGKNKLRSIAQQIDTEEIKPLIEIVKEWHEDYHNGSLKRDKETSREQEYNQQFFKAILGYKEKPASPFSFEPKATTDKGQLPDAVISYTDTANDIRNTIAVVELKGAAIDLDRPQRREGNMSPVQQGFKYKAQYRACPFVIVSNFWEFRLYHDNLLDYEAWTLDDLVDPEDDYILFKTWYALLKHDNFTTSKGASKTEALLSDIRIEQENIGKKFYKVYREARLDLLRDIYSNNDSVRNNIDVGIEKAQKIVDRIVFAAFAEDRGLLPDNTLQRVIKAADSSTFGGSLWNTLKGFFEAIDVGSEKLEIPDGYNGGLFKHDETLNNLRITDAPLRKVVELGTYNFSEDLSVNILGHIFEQSISDLEEIKSKVRESQNIESLAVSRRKKDGIFYTPDYIVRYIVDNSLGSYLREHEEKFKNEFGLKGDITDKTYEKREKQAYSKYQDFLQNIKVVDPACGSGAFLVYVFDYLLAENKRVSDIVGNSLFSSDTYVRDILRNNIYGVDLNEESVEITKLSLWLKTAQKGKKLTALDGNIKCGNSLIDDPEIAGSKAFDWQKEFADIFKNGGFDVIVGNPPYVNARTMDSIDRRFLNDSYSELQGSYDLYVAFLLKAHKLLRQTGRYGWIIPNKLLIADYAKKVLQVLEDKSLETIVNVSKIPVFNGVGVYPIIITGNMARKKSSSQRYNITAAEQLSGVEQFKAEKNTFKRFKTLASVGFKINSGTTGFEAQKIKALLNEDGNGIPFAVSGSIDPYVVDTELVPYMKSRYVRPHITSSSDEIADSKYKFWNSKKIVVAGMTKRIEAVYTARPLALGVGVYGIYDFAGYEPKALASILNSKFMTFYLLKEFADKHLAGGYLAINKSTLEQLPIVSIDDAASDQLVALHDSYRNKLNDLNEKKNNFQTLMQSEFGITKLPTKLNRWWNMDYADFINGLKTNISMAQKDELLQLFNKYKTELESLDNELQKTDDEINRLVYKLYDLTPEEIATVEGAK